MWRGLNFLGGTKHPLSVGKKTRSLIWDLLLEQANEINILLKIRKKLLNQKWKHCTVDALTRKVECSCNNNTNHSYGISVIRSNTDPWSSAYTLTNDISRYGARDVPCYVQYCSVVHQRTVSNPTTPPSSRHAFVTWALAMVNREPRSCPILYRWKWLINQSWPEIMDNAWCFTRDNKI